MMKAIQIVNKRDDVETHGEKYKMWMTNGKGYKKNLNTGTGDLEMGDWATELYKGREIIVFTVSNRVLNT